METSSSSSDSDDNMFEELKLMENKDPWVRLSTYGKLKKMVSKFEGKKINELEQNLCRGLFIRRLKDFSEDTKKESKKTLLERLTSSVNLDSPNCIVDNNHGFVENSSQIQSMKPTIDRKSGENLTHPTDEIKDFK